MARAVSPAAAVFLLGLIGLEPALAQEPSFLPDPPQYVLAFPDDGRAVSKRIVARDGGEIVATAEDGTRYRLVLQKDSLLYDTTVTLAPWASADGFDSAPMIGFSIEPNGTTLYNPATIYIEPGENAIKTADPRNILLFETEGQGREQARIALPTPDGIGLYLFHFSGGGAFEGGEAVTRFFVNPYDYHGDYDNIYQREHVAGLTYQQAIDKMGDWQRRVTQDRNAGRVDDFKAGQQMEIIDHLIKSAWDLGAPKRADEMDRQLQTAETEAFIASADAEAMARAGKSSDRNRILKTLSKMLEFERQQALLGRPGDDRLMDRLRELYAGYAKSLAKSCGSQVVSPRESVAMERTGELLGLDSSEADWADTAARLRKCKSEISLDQAIETCFAVGDYRPVLDLYEQIALRARPEFSDGTEALTPEDLSLLRQKVLDALGACARFEMKIRVKSKATERQTYISNTSPPYLPDTVVFSWIWTDELQLAFRPSAEMGDILAGEIVGESEGAVESCGCEITEPGYMLSCKISKCEMFHQDEQDLREKGIAEMIFDGSRLQELRFHGTATLNLLRNQCYRYPSDTEVFCGDVGGSELPMVGCLDLQMSTNFGGLPLEVQPASQEGSWRGRVECGPSDIWRDDPPDAGFLIQSDEVELELRHIGTH